MIIHLVPHADEIMILTGGRTRQPLFRIAPESVLGMETGEEISDALPAEDIMAYIQRDASV